MSPSPPDDAARFKHALDRAVQEPLSVADRKQAIDFIRAEVPAFEVSGRTTYLVLGSYRNDFEQNLRLVQSELNKRTDTFAAVLGDLRDPEFDQRSAFAIKLHLTATYADWGAFTRKNPVARALNSASPIRSTSRRRTFSHAIMRG